MSHPFWPLMENMMDEYVSSNVDFFYQLEINSSPFMFKNFTTTKE